MAVAMGTRGTEVEAKAKRRRFTAEYKRRILQDAAACAAPGEIGALLRREGLYSSHLAAWRSANERGELRGPAKRRGPKPSVDAAARRRNAELEREVLRWRRRAERAELVVDTQKKLSVLLGIDLGETTEKP